MSRRQRLNRFFENHPNCIFCGGATPAITEDHVPSRQLFNERWWPEGYVFPACTRCNESTRRAEQVVALLSRFSPGRHSERDDIEFKSILKAVKNNDPEILQELWTNSQQAADFAAKPWAGPLIRSGAIASRPLSAKGPRLNAYIRDYARKLFCALHYKEFGTIIAPAGGIFWRWFTNAQRFDGKIPDNLIADFTTIPVVKRTNRNLGDQFSYRFDMAIDGEVAAYFAVFRHSFALLGIVDPKGSFPELSSPDYDVLKPLSIAAAE